jgi:hypothetical protein
MSANPFRFLHGIPETRLSLWHSFLVQACLATTTQKADTPSVVLQCPSCNLNSLSLDRGSVGEPNIHMSRSRQERPPIEGKLDFADLSVGRVADIRFGVCGGTAHLPRNNHCRSPLVLSSSFYAPIVDCHIQATVRCRGLFDDVEWYITITDQRLDQLRLLGQIGSYSLLAVRFGNAILRTDFWCLEAYMCACIYTGCC